MTLIAPSWSRRQVLAALGPVFMPQAIRQVWAEPLNTLEPLDLPTPNTAIVTSKGQTTSLADYAPMPLLVNFWASWCPPCIHELPALARLDQVLASEGMGVLLVGVDRKGPAFGEQFLAERSITIRHRAYDAEGDLARQIGIRAMPTSFLLTGKGQLIGKLEGVADWDDPEVVAAVLSRLR